MEETATRIYPKFRKQIQQVSKDKLQGNVVGYFRTHFPATEVMRSKAAHYASTAPASASKKKVRYIKAAPKRRKKA
jgi:hypothetical protein